MQHGESQGIILRAPSVSDRGVGGENENQKCHPPLKDDRREEEHYTFSSIGICPSVSELL